MAGIAYITVIDSDTTIDPNNGIDTYIVDASIGDIVILLPQINGDGTIYKFKRSDTTTNIVTIDAHLGDNINNDVFIILYRYTNVELNSMGNTWYTVSGNYSPILPKATYNMNSIQIIATNSNFTDAFYFPWKDLEYNSLDGKYINATIIIRVQNVDVNYPPEIRVIDDDTNNILVSEIINSDGTHRILIPNNSLPNYDTHFIIQIMVPTDSTTTPEIFGANIDFDVI
jgi:hypothetical protein